MDQNNEVDGVQFETDSYQAVKFYSETNTPKMVRLAMKYSGGLIKEEKKAHWVLFGFVILAVSISIFLLFNSRRGPNIPLPPGAKIIYPPNELPRLLEPVTR